MRKFKQVVQFSFRAFLPLVVLAFLATPILLGADASAGSTAGEIREGVDSVSGENTVNTDLEDIIRIIVNAVLFLIGVVAVIMIIIGGFRYTTSGGDSSQTKAAKDTIMYAVIGIVVAILAFAIVNFVLDTLGAA